MVEQAWGPEFKSQYFQTLKPLPIPKIKINGETSGSSLPKKKKKKKVGYFAPKQSLAVSKNKTLKKKEL
jgi:hypothetical protein